MGLGSSTRHAWYVSYYLNKLLKSEFFILLTLRKFFVLLNSFLFYRTPNNLEEPGSPLQRLLVDLFPNAPRRPPPRRCINFDDSGFCNNLPISPIKIIFDSDDSDVSDDSGVIVISSDEFEEENEDISDDDGDDGDADGSINLNNAIDRSPITAQPLKDQGYFEWFEYYVVYI